MNDLHRIAFIKAAADIGSPKDFRTSGGSLKDFLENEVREGDAPDVVAAKILCYFCTEGGLFNNCMPGLALAIRFLDTTLDGPADGMEKQQALKDLKANMVPSSNFNQLLTWVRSNYR
jgi:hypothetical protein